MHGAPEQNVSTRRKGPRPETRRRDLIGRDRDETARRDVSASRDGLETETSRPRPHPCENVKFSANSFLF